MANDLILEIGTEELPPSCTRKGLEDFKVLLEKRLIENQIKFKNIDAYSSPRRLTAIVSDINLRQDTIEKIVTGPLKNISFGSDGKPNKAAVGFAKRLDVTIDDLEEIDIKDKGIYLGKKIVQEGKKTAEILPELLKNTIISLSFNKQMFWGAYDTRFIRPIRWLLALLGDKVIDFKIENVRSGNVTYGHRMLNTEPINIPSTGKYFERLKDQGNVIADPAIREKKILGQIGKIEKKLWNGGKKAVVKKRLLDEVVDLVDIPNVLVGSFPKDFLYIPTDILMEAIQYHQKYLPVVDGQGRVTTDFLIVQNGLKDNGDIRRGNERVLRARLSDASFFYEQDKKHDFDFWEEKLEGVIFYTGLGTMNDKQKRLKKISAYLAGQINNNKDSKNMGHFNDASLMCKCDLVTNLVVEFPELQGIVGREYARERGFDKEVPEAIFEHYLPRYAGDRLPVTETGRVLSIADKADIITGMFLAGNIPSGSEDPFALRRKALGIVRTILDGKYTFSLRNLIDFCLELYKESFDIRETGVNTSNKIFNFIQARQRFIMAKNGKRMDVLDAALGSDSSSLLDIGLRCDAIWDYMSKNDIKEIVWPMSRSKNIIINKTFGPVDNKLFKEKCEEELFGALTDIEGKTPDLLKDDDYGGLLKILERFGKTVDVFFDEVIIMDKDTKVKDNRINLLKRVADLYTVVADFSRIVIENDMK